MVTSVQLITKMYLRATADLYGFNISEKRYAKNQVTIIKLSPSSTQLSTKFILLINLKKPTIDGILRFISMINTTSGRLVYKLKKIVGSNYFSAQFIKIISHYKKIGYNINVLQQTACLVVNPITVGNFAFLFNCTPVGRTSDSMMVPT